VRGRPLYLVEREVNLSGRTATEPAPTVALTVEPEHSLLEQTTELSEWTSFQAVVCSELSPGVIRGR
jgi:hypothetical protein